MLTVETGGAVQPPCLAAVANACTPLLPTRDVNGVARQPSRDRAHRPARKRTSPFLPADRAASFGLPAWTASWWHGHEGELQAALEVAYVAAPHLRAAALFLLPRLPCLVRASSTIKGAGEGEREFSRLLPLAEALTHQWVSFNGPHWLNTFTADIDHADWRSTLLDMVANRGLPMPLMTVQSAWKGSVHLVWALERPLWKKCAKQTRLRKGISRGLVLTFGACSRFSNGLQKNPWHRSSQQVTRDTAIPCGDQVGWDAYQAAATGTTYHTEVMQAGTVTGKGLLLPLLDVAAERGVMLLSPKVGAVAEGGRHIPLAPILGDAEEQPRGKRLFYCAARTVRRACTGDRGRILQITERTALALGSPADRRAIEAISSSIADWMNTQWWGPLDGKPGMQSLTGGRNVDFGVMTGEAADKGGEALEAWRQLSQLEKRQAAAARSNVQRTAKADKAIRATIGVMLREGLKLTQKAVAQRSGISHSTVHRRWHSLDLSAIREEEELPDSLIRSWGSPGSSSPVVLVTPSAIAKTANESVKARRVAEQKALARYKSQAVRLMRPGAMMEEVAAITASASEALHAAYQSARIAERDLLRRIEAREARERAKLAAIVRHGWHAEHRDDDEAWQARLADLITRCERAVEALADRPQTARKMEMMFASVIRAEWRARRLARGEKVPAVVRTRRRLVGPWHPYPDEYDLLIPW